MTTKTILIIDDDDGLRASLSMALQQKGYLIEEATNGIDGILKSKERQYDLIISDISMPELDGNDAIPQIKESENNALTPIMVLSGSLDEPLYLSLKQYIAKAFLKPIDPFEVATSVQKFLEKK